MKKILCPMLSALTSLSLFTSAVSFSAVAFSDTSDIETGVIDMSDEHLVLGDSDNIYFDYPEILADSGTGNWILGDYLDTNNTAVYAKLSELVTPSIDEITVELPEPIKFTTTSEVTASDQNLYNAVFGACSSAFDAVSFDMPEIFWLNKNEMSVSPNNMLYSYNRRTGIYTYTLQALTIRPAYYSGFSDFDEIFEYKELLEKAVDDFVVEGDTNAEKLKSIHDKIANFTYYDSSAQFPGSALGSLVTSGSVCESYSKGFKMICDKIGIPCICVFGNYDEDTKFAHMWNYVLMEDNCWYAVDLTWDDTDGENGVEVTDTYFLKGSADFNKSHSQYEEYGLVHLNYPEIAEWNYGENPQFTTTTTSTTTTTTTATTTTSTTTETTTTSKPTTTTTKATTTTTKTTTDRPTTTTTTTTSTTTTESPEEYEYGDLNHDGKVSIADLVYCTSYVLAIEKTEYSCDINNDNRADVYDVIIMRQIIDNIISEQKARLG